MSAVLALTEADISASSSQKFNVGIALNKASHSQRLVAFNAILATMNDDGRGYADMTLLIGDPARWRNIPYSVIEAFRNNRVSNTTITAECKKHLGG